MTTYRNAHRRVRAAGGSATGWSCVDCGQQAVEWSYDHADPDERHDERGRAYSDDPQHYQPRCRPCHSRFDREARADTVAALCPQPKPVSTQCSECGASEAACEATRLFASRACCPQCDGHDGPPERRQRRQGKP